MIKHAQTLPASTERAQCYNIAGLNLNPNETIAERIARDHCDTSSHLRAASLMVDAGCATEVVKKEGCYGTFTFEDGSYF